jgi:hypothetical protein
LVPQDFTLIKDMPNQQNFVDTSLKQQERMELLKKLEALCTP